MITVMVDKGKYTPYEAMNVPSQLTLRHKNTCIHVTWFLKAPENLALSLISNSNTTDKNNKEFKSTLCNFLAGLKNKQQCRASDARALRL